MKRFLIIFFMLLTVASINAQPQPKSGQPRFNPEQFVVDLEKYITKEAHLTQQEQTAFFPLLREMLGKQRELFAKHRIIGRTPPRNDAEARKLINDMDKLDMDIKKLQTLYHAKFMKVIPATKVLACIRAEEQFKHVSMERMARGRHKGGKK